MESGIRVFTNIDDETFVGMMHGKEYSVGAGKDLPLPEKIAKHLAGQLAYKMLMKKDAELLLGPENQGKLAETIVSELVMEGDEEVEEVVEDKKKEVKEETFADLKPKRAYKKRAKK